MNIFDEYMQFLLLNDVDDEPENQVVNFMTDNDEKIRFKELKAKASLLHLNPSLYFDADELEDAIYQKEILDIDAEFLNMDSWGYETLEDYQEAIEKMRELHNKAEELEQSTTFLSAQELEEAITIREKLIADFAEIDFQPELWKTNEDLQIDLEKRQQIAQKAKIYNLDPNDYDEKYEVDDAIAELLDVDAYNEKIRSKITIKIITPTLEPEEISNKEKMEALAKEYNLNVNHYYDLADIQDVVKELMEKLALAQELEIDTTEDDWKYELENAQDYQNVLTKFNFDYKGLKYKDLELMCNFFENFPQHARYQQIKVNSKSDMPSAIDLFIHKILIDEFAEIFNINLRDFDSKIEYENKVIEMCQRLGFKI